MKSYLCIILLICAFSYTISAKSHQIKQSRNQEVFDAEQSSKELEHHATKLTKKHHAKKSLRMHGLSAKDVYDEIKKLQSADQARLDQLESQRTVLISQRTATRQQYEMELNKTNSFFLLFQNSTFTLEQYTTTKTTYESQKITVDKEISKLDQQRVQEESNLKELNSIQQKRVSNVQTLRSDISKKNEEIERLKQALIKAENEKKDFETQLTTELSQSTSNQEQISKQQVKISEVTGCIKKQQTQKEQVIIEITRIITEITKFTQVRQQLDTQYQFQLNISNNLKKTIDDLSKKIEEIQAQIADLKMRICSYFDKNKSETQKLSEQKKQEQTESTSQAQQSSQQATTQVIGSGSSSQAINKASVQVERQVEQQTQVKYQVGKNSANVVEQKTLPPPPKQY